MSTGHTASNSLGLTQEDFAILCEADHESPVLIKMIVGDDRDAILMRELVSDEQQVGGSK